MKGLMLFIMLFFAGLPRGRTQPAILDGLVYTRQFTLLNKKLEDPAYKNIPHKAIYQALLFNAFGNAGESNRLIEEVFAKKIDLPDSLVFYLEQARVNNYISLNDYKNAVTRGNELLERFPAFFDSNELEDEQHALRIWKQLEKVKPQELTKQADTKITCKKDLAGLWNIPVTVNDSSYAFVFDSGAGISTIVDSYAKKLNLLLLDDSGIRVRSGITGIANRSKLGIAKEIHIGNMTIRNVVFLVFPDSSMTFANGAYKIDGIIGFPVIREFGSLSIYNNEMFIPVKDSGKLMDPNMTIDQLKPVIYLYYHGDELPFTFDTGANSSTFSDNFYNRYKAVLDHDGVERKVTMEGAGGNKTINVMEIPELSFRHYFKNIILKKAQVSKERISTNNSFYFGNLGHDIIDQFKKLTINFTRSYILFE